MKNTLKTHLSLLVHSPRDYLYSFKYSGRKCIRITPYNPDSYQAARKLMRELKKLCPVLDLYLIGSVGLQIEGRGDIDLYATVDPTEYQSTFAMVCSIYGQSKKPGKKYNEWDFKYGDFLVELVLTTPRNRRFQEQIRLFNLLKNNRVYLEEYRNLKKRLNDTSAKEYTRKRMEFFNRILG